MPAQSGVVRVTFKDIGGNLTTRSYELAGSNVGGTKTVSEIEALGQSLVDALQDISDCGVGSFEVAIKFAATAPTTPQAGSEMENTAAVSLPLNVVGPSGLTTFGLLSIPGPKIGIFTGESGLNYNTVDLADADLLTLIDLFQSGGSADFTMSDGQSVAASLTEAYGFRVHRRSRRSRSRRIG